VVACFTTNGSAFGLLTSENFSIVSEPGKLVLCVLMLAGRLEMYTVVLMFSRSYWNSGRSS
jgi:trk system potassium uptake protein TrkH